MPYQKQMLFSVEIDEVVLWAVQWKGLWRKWLWSVYNAAIRMEGWKPRKEGKRKPVRTAGAPFDTRTGYLPII